MPRRTPFPYSIAIVLLALSFWLWSFTQTDPNLYYSSTNFWVAFQQSLWQISKTTAVWWYIGNIAVSFALYFYALKTTVRLSFTPFWKTSVFLLPLLLTTCFLLLLSNNALSHDIYNYIFNAKAVAIYHMDPHLLSALEIAPSDDWVRFMHNVHTTAPYGRFWTFVTLIPFYLGVGKFLTTYLAFKAFMAMGLGLLAYVQWKMIDEKKELALFLLNPLVLIETLMNGHNDVWMMGLALASLMLVYKTKKPFSVTTVISLGLLFLSTQIKLATLLLLPIWVLFIFRQFSKNENYPSASWVTRILRMTYRYWAELSSLLLFIPLLTDRSQQFNPWYLIWPLTFFPFFRSRYMKILLITFSVTSLLRYIPFLFAGEYTDTIQFQMRLITWSAVLVASGWFLVTRARGEK